ncbi:MAG: glycosyltransferase N-terminal domain-containing protein [Desulfobacterales bacterium]|nr:glycosyltransferase N-terminal domain-containing protein [Desulfobacterales bacterium]
MNFAYQTYRLLTTVLFLFCLPIFRLAASLSPRHQAVLNQRLGCYAAVRVKNTGGSPRIWLHAASVGEVGVAKAIMAHLVVSMPDSALILSSTTEHGVLFAREKLGSRVTCVYAPLDFTRCVRKAFGTLQPDILVCIETEIWPNWMITAQKMGIKTALVNGRISIRSIRRYLYIRPLMKETLKNVDAFSMIRPEDAERIRSMGADRDKIEVNGNAKYDILPLQADHILKTALARRYRINDRPVFLAGSTRTTEENVILDVYQKIIRSFPETILLIAPRHVERSGHIQRLVNERGFSCQLRTHIDENRPRSAPVVILDTIGELQATYSIATLVFCGGSLVPRGGQNVLEAAAWGKLVFYGPSMEDFLDARDLLSRAGGGIEVRDGKDLAEKAIYYLSHPEEAGRIGRRAKEAIRSHTGAARKHAEVIHRLVRDRG